MSNTKLFVYFNGLYRRNSVFANKKNTPMSVFSMSYVMIRLCSHTHIITVTTIIKTSFSKWLSFSLFSHRYIDDSV